MGILEVSGILGILLFIFVVILLPIALTAFTIWAVIDCATNEPSEGNDKLVWMAVIIFGYFVAGIGAFVYYFVRRPTRIREYGQ
ncbi:hypothetical protein Pla110_46390 [Polystyrenella longa]|uniref:Cardiolipin synthase N-terminal domain-containing protein n=1 Tax=Polystyrenella longa TaxID=2528007 RepID=A0A518CUH6_9PLAN|nr:PLDc N-terminal domain-containing protein [Polystyrenella longa]QDU82876.1 hypothetical protein Pla110_46390 [Polystyrenella longa]